MNSLKRVSFLSLLVSSLAVTVILPILAPLVRELGLTETQGGWMISLGSVAMVASAPIWGRFSDRQGRKPVLLAGFAGLCATYALYTTAIWSGLSGLVAGFALFALLVVTRALVGIVLPAVQVAATAMIADQTSTQERSAGMAIAGAATGLGFVVGPALGGLMALGGLIWPLLFTTALCLVATVAVLLAVPSTPPPPPAAHPPRVDPLGRALRPWLAAGVLTMCGIVTMQITTGFYVQDRLGLTTAQTGSLLAVGLTLVGVLLVATQVFQIKVLKWQPARMIAVGALLWIGGLLLFLLTAHPVAYLAGYAILGVGSGLLYPGYMAGASLAVGAESQGAVAGLSSAVQGVGAIVAPIASTALYELDMRLPLWCILGLMALLCVFFAGRPARRPSARTG
jgi:MFS family permease